MMNTISGNFEEVVMVMKVIKTQFDYDAALSTIENLLDQDPNPGTPEAEALELLTLLVQDYESKQIPKEMPDPITAIQFRMEQQGLSHRDLIPYFGSRSRISEVLSGRRPLSISMIRALHTGLGIPASVLLQKDGAALPEEANIDWKKFPLREMVKRGWIEANLIDIKDRAEELMLTFLAPLKLRNIQAALYKHTNHVRSARSMDEFALFAWTTRILIRAKRKPAKVTYIQVS